MILQTASAILSVLSAMQELTHSPLATTDANHCASRCRAKVHT